jgi:hypothetical protein
MGERVGDIAGMKADPAAARKSARPPRALALGYRLAEVVTP